MVKWANRPDVDRYNGNQDRRRTRQDPLRSTSSGNHPNESSIVSNPQHTYAFGTPTTHHQDHEGYPSQFRSTSSNRNFAGLSFSADPQNTTTTTYTFEIPNSHHHHQHHHQNSQRNISIAQELPQAHPNAITTSNSEDPTEQIRVSVEDTHISHGFYGVNESGGNITGVLDSFDEKAVPTYGNIVAQHQVYLNDNSPSDLVRSDIQNHSDNQYVDQSRSSFSPSTLATASSSSSRAESFSLLQSTTASSVASPPLPRIRRVNEPCTRDNSKQQQDTRDALSREISRSNGSSSSSDVASLTSFDFNDHINASARRETSTDINQVQFNPKELQSVRTEPSPQKSLVKAANSQRQNQRRDLPIEETQVDTSTKKEPNNFESFSIINTMPAYANNPQIGIIKNYLFNGSSFSGYQMSEKYKYGVNVKIQHVDYENSYICGYLCIAHLTRNHPSLTTFFEGEIISDRYSFFTGKWGATPEIDRAHWSKFSDFAKKEQSVFKRHDFNYNDLKNSDYIYMRWKERFLVPDHTIKFVDGASYDGFYYTCYSKRSSQIKGYYFHLWDDEFEKFQSLSLKFDCHERSAQVYEFR